MQTVCCKPSAEIRLLFKKAKVKFFSCSANFANIERNCAKLESAPCGKILLLYLYPVRIQGWY